MKIKHIIKFYFPSYTRIVAYILFYLFVSLIYINLINMELQLKDNWWVHSTKFVSPLVGISILGLSLFLIMNFSYLIVARGRSKYLLIKSLGGTDLSIKKSEVYVYFIFSSIMYICSYVLPIFIYSFGYDDFKLPSLFYFISILVIIFTIHLIPFKNKTSKSFYFLCYALSFILMIISSKIITLNRNYYMSKVDNININEIESKLNFFKSIFDFISNNQFILICLIIIPFGLYFYKFFKEYLNSNLGGSYSER